jgi:hypothetical protein
MQPRRARSQGHVHAEDRTVPVLVMIISAGTLQLASAICKWVRTSASVTRINHKATHVTCPGIATNQI